MSSHMIDIVVSFVYGAMAGWLACMWAHIWLDTHVRGGAR